MSLWDFVAAASIATNINDSNSKSAKILKKINSASLNVLNGDKVDYVGCGGRTTNTFGAVTVLNCDMEMILENWLVGVTGAGQLGTFMLGALFGPASVNLMNIGNKTELQYSTAKLLNYNFRCGGENVNTVYDSNQVEGIAVAGLQMPKSKKVVLVLIALFALAIYGFYLIYNFAGVFGKGIMSPVGNSGYIKNQQGNVGSKQKEIAALEASEAQQKKEQQQRTDAGYVLSPAEQEAKDTELQDTQDQLTAAESQKAELESTLKTAERQKEWLIYGNVILENRGFLVIKTVEIILGAAMTLENQTRTYLEHLFRTDKDGKQVYAGLDQAVVQWPFLEAVSSNNKSVGISVQDSVDNADQIVAEVKRQSEDIARNVSIASRASSAGGIYISDSLASLP